MKSDQPVTRRYWYPSLKKCLGETFARDKGPRARAQHYGTHVQSSPKGDAFHLALRQLVRRHALAVSPDNPKPVIDRWRRWARMSGGEVMLRSDPDAAAMIAELEDEGIVEPPRGPPVGVEHVEFADLNDEDRAMIETFRELKR